MNTLLAAISAFKWSSFLMMAVFALGLFLSVGRLNAAQPDPATAEAARTALVDWLECEECSEGQLKQVLEQGQWLESMLVATVKSGLAPATRELYKRELEKRHDALMRYSEKHPNSKPTLDKPKYVALYLDNFDAQYRTRAAEALVELGSAQSREVLEQAIKEARRADVKQALSGYLKRLR